MKTLTALFAVCLMGVAQADEGPMGDSGTAPIAPSWNPDVSHGVLDLSNQGAGTYIPYGSSLLGTSPQAREGIDSLGGFDGTQPTPGVVGGQSSFPDLGPSDRLAPVPGAAPLNGSSPP